ncbi:MAG: hypothetical protein FJW23_06030 [Acidimicrobiia bacterium]|nr:hypothetical protein [Acidimicrobiia bacterium]
MCGRLALVLGGVLCTSGPLSAQPTPAEAGQFEVAVAAGQRIVASIWFRNGEEPVSGRIEDAVSGDLVQGFSDREDTPGMAACGPSVHYSALACDFETTAATARTFRFRVGRNPASGGWEPALLTATPGDDDCHVVFENEFASWEIAVLTGGTCTATAPIWTAR